MDGNEPDGPFQQIAGSLEAAQNRAGHHRPPLVVPLEMGGPVRAHAAAEGLGNVM